MNGLDEAPQKLQQLGELNKILAHRPWLLTKEHIEVRGWPVEAGPTLLLEARVEVGRFDWVCLLKYSTSRASLLSPLSNS